MTDTWKEATQNLDDDHRVSYLPQKEDGLLGHILLGPIVTSLHPEEPEEDVSVRRQLLDCHAPPSVVFTVSSHSEVPSDFPPSSGEPLDHTRRTGGGDESTPVTLDRLGVVQ